MTNEQALHIRKLREQGVGYQTIGKIVNLSRDSVRSYCKNHGLNGYPCEMQYNVMDRMEAGEACAYCGANLKNPKTGRPRRFCTDECRREYWKTHRDKINKGPASVYTMVCAYCGEIFESYGNKKRKYCCHDHYIKDRFWQEDEEDTDGAKEATDRQLDTSGV